MSNPRPSEESVRVNLLVVVAVLALASLPVARSATARAAASNYVALDGCGAAPTDRLCMAYPTGCVATSTCTLMLSVRPDPDDAAKYLFQMGAQNTGYVAVALAESELMGVDSVVECIMHPTEGSMYLYQSVNKAYNQTTGKRGNSRLPAEEQKGVTVKESTLRNGVIGCSFSRDKVTTVRSKSYDLEQAWYLQVAGGNRINNDTSIHHHGQWATSGSAVKLSAPGLVADSHGSTRNPSPNNAAGPAAAASSAVMALVAVVSAVRAL